MIVKIHFPIAIRRRNLLFRELIFFLLLLSYMYLITDPVAYLFGISSHTQTFGDHNLKGLLRVLILAPVLEELFFRIHLSGKKKHAWGVLLMVIPLSLIFKLGWILIILLLFGGFIILFYDKFSEFISVRFFTHVFFLSSFLFALAHFHQIDSETIFGRLLIIIIAYFPIGLYFGYVRMNYGLPIVICMHSLLNFSVLAINSLIY